MRTDGRRNDELRPVSITRNFTSTPAGSVLWKQGNTIVLATASILPDVPPWFGDHRAGGWVTADYVMLPGSTPRRKDWPKIGHTDSRGTEIQRIVGRSLRAIVDLSKIGPHTIAVDCQVLQADGGTRTASICAGFLALRDAVARLPREFPVPRGSPVPAEGGTLPPRFDPRFYAPAEAVVDDLAAVSVGIVAGEVRLDLDYADDSVASVDLNVAFTGRGRFVEVQGSAENGEGFEPAKMGEMTELAVRGCRQLLEVMRRAT